MEPTLNDRAKYVTTAMNYASEQFAKPGAEPSLKALGELEYARRQIEDSIAYVVADLREYDAERGTPGTSWSQIGGALGMTKQGAQQRYGNVYGQLGGTSGPHV